MNEVTERITLALSNKTMDRISELADRSNQTPDELINNLLVDETERLDLLAEYQQGESIKLKAPLQKVIALVNASFSNLSSVSEIYEYHTSIELMHEKMLEEKLISLSCLPDAIAESERLRISRIAYYWYAGVIANAVAKVFGCYSIYLWHEMIATNSEFVFIGPPTNVVACYHVCDRLCKLLKKTKSKYKADEGSWGSKSEIEESANQYIAKFAQGIIPADSYIYHEETQLRLIDYALDKYSYAMR